VRVRVARGNIAYSAVSHPSPLPRFHPGTPSSTDAVHNTLVAPKVIRHDPSAYGATPRSKVIGRSADSSRPTRFALADFTEFPDDCRRRVSWGEGNDDDCSAPAFHFLSADDRFFRVVAALHDNIGLEVLDEIQRRVLRKNDNEIHAFERSEHVGTFPIAAHRTGWPLQAPHRFIAVYSHNESVRRFTRGGQHIDVAGVEQVEHPVGESDLSLPPRPPAFCLYPRSDLPCRIPRLQSLLTAEG
jgi:hypothetical protein